MCENIISLKSYFYIDISTDFYQLNDLKEDCRVDIKEKYIRKDIYDQLKLEIKNEL